MSDRAFLYLECPDCGWDCVLPEADVRTGLICPLCAEDNGRDTGLRWREALATDRVEGRDARQEPAR